MRDSTRWHVPFLIALSAGWESLFLWKGINPLDEGWALYAGMQLDLGRTLYDDIFWVFPPGHVLPAWLGHAVDPGGVLVPRLIYAAFTVGLVVALYRLGRRLMPADFALFGAALLAVAAARSHMMHLLFGYRYMLFAVLVLLAYARHLETGRRAWIVAAGALAGLCLFFRVTPAFAVSLGVGVAIATQPGSWRDRVAAWLGYAGGLAGVIAPVLVYFETTVGVERLFGEVILRPMAMLQPLPVPDLFAPDLADRDSITAAWSALSLRLYALLFAGAAFSLGVSYLRSRAGRRPFEDPLLVAVVVWGAVFFLRAFGRADQPHLDTTLPPICLLLAWAGSRGLERLRPRLPSRERAARVAWIGIFALWVLLLDSDSVLRPHHFGYLGIPDKVKRGVALIEASTPPGARLLDLSAAPLFHVLTGRPGAGRSDVIMPGTFDRASEEIEFVLRLDDDPPAAVLWPVRHFDDMRSRSVEVVAPRVVSWVRARYRPGETTDKFRIWLPRRPR